MTTLNQDVQDAIKKNLPELAAAELKSFIIAAENNAALVQTLKDKIGGQAARILELEAQVQAQDVLTSREKALVAGQTKLQADQLALAHSEAKNVAEVANASRDATLTVVGMFLRNTEIRTHIARNVAVPVEGCPGNNGNYGSPGMVHTANESEHTTVSQD